VTNAHRLALVRGVHTTIYSLMAASTLVLPYAGLTRAQGRWLWTAMVLLAIETVVFTAYTPGERQASRVAIARR